MISIKRCYEILGLSPGCSAADAKRAYHERAKRYHPDLAPDGERRRRQLAMMRVNEAYVAVLEAITAAEERPRPTPTAAPTAARAYPEPREEFFRRWEAKAASQPPSPEKAVGTLRDPAYVYYKAGFRAYNEGATALYRKEGRELRRFLQNGGTFDAYVLRLVLHALASFERSYSYFLVVTERYPESPWVADARWKLHRLERYNAIYQRICENLSRRSSIRRSSFSIVSGADPS